MKDALAIHRMLLECETLHEIVRLPSAIHHADELPKVLALPAGRCLVTHVYTIGSTRREARALAGVIAHAGQEPVAEVVRQRLGARAIRHARADQINAATDYTAHLVCPLLLPPAMRLFIDRSIIEDIDDRTGGGVVYTAAGEPFTALAIRLTDLCTLSGAEPISFSSGAGPGTSDDASAPASATPPASAPMPPPVRIPSQRARRFTLGTPLHDLTERLTTE